MKFKKLIIVETKQGTGNELPHREAHITDENGKKYILGAKKKEKKEKRPRIKIKVPRVR